MYLLKASLFQSLHVELEEGQLLDLGSPTSRSLFAYLILHRSKPSDRRRLAFMFWPRGTEVAARRNLRQYLHRLRRHLEPIPIEEDPLLADGSSVQLNPKLQIWVDVEAFLHGTRPEANLVERQAAISLYRGELLEELYEDWCEEMRVQLRNTYLDSLDRLSQSYEAAGNMELACDYAQKWVDEEELSEAAYRRLITLLMANGEKSSALLACRRLEETLLRELHAQPSLEFQDLYQAILDNTFQADRPRNVSAKPRLERISPPELPMVGRMAELDELREIWSRGRSGLGRFVLITGESGIGKTRLMQEFLTDLEDSSALRVDCNELTAIVPYAPVRQLLQITLEKSPDLSLKTIPPWLLQITNLLPSFYPPGKDRHPRSTPISLNQYTELLIELYLEISAKAAPGPLALIFDDAQWADHQTWEFLAQLSLWASTKPLVIICVCRLEDVTVDHHRLIRSLERKGLLHNIPLDRLTLAQTEKLANHLLEEDRVDPLSLRRLFQETEGNPFFIIETVRATLESAGRFRLPFDRHYGDQALRVPFSIKQVIESRLDRLSFSGQELISTAAVAGRDFSLALLEAISKLPTEEIIECIEEWIQRGLVQEGPANYVFSHEKIRQVAYANLSRARRQFLHRRFAEVLEDSIPPADVATLAHHYSRSDQPFRALPFFAEAGEQALSVRSYHEARQFGLQAINLLGNIPGPRESHARIDLNLQLSQAYAFAGKYKLAQEILIETEHLAVRLGDEQKIANIYYRSSQIFWLRGQPAVAGDYARRTLRAAEELHDSQLLRAALRMLGRVSIAVSGFDDAIAYLLRYINEETKSPQSHDLPIVLGYLGVAYSRVGSWQRAEDAGYRGIELAKIGGSQEALRFAYMQFASIWADQLQWDRCFEALNAVPDSERHEASFTPYTFMKQSLLGLTRAHLGETLQGIEMIRQALQWAEQTDYRVFHYLPRLFLAQSLILANEYSAAGNEIHQLQRAAGETGNRWAKGVALRMRAEVLSRQPNPDWTFVESCLIEATQLLRHIRARPDLARAYLAMRRLYDRGGQIAWAVDCHFRATMIFDELGMVEELRLAQGQAAGERRGAVVIPNMALRGPHPLTPSEEDRSKNR